MVGTLDTHDVKWETAPDPKPFRVPSGELQIIIAFQGTLEDDVPSRMLGYVSSLQGNSGKINQEAKLKLFPLGLFADVAKVHRLQIVWALKMPIGFLSILIGILMMFPLLILSPKGLSGVMVCGPGSGHGRMWLSPKHGIEGQVPISLLTSIKSYLFS